MSGPSVRFPLVIPPSGPSAAARARRAVPHAILLLCAAPLLGGCVAGVGFATPAYYGGYGDPGVAVQVQVAPPPLPVYVQPPCPGDGYLWVPGYWAYASGYYWVPGTWVLPPQIGVLWTPGYWGFERGVYVWNTGYWGPRVGYYGGVHYGFGYDGNGYVGGRWRGSTFVYNRYVTNVNVNIRNTYIRRVNRNVVVNRVSYNGGRGGLTVMPNREQRFERSEAHVPVTYAQRRHAEDAARNPALFERANHGRPSIAATPRAGAFHGPGIERARGARAYDQQRGLNQQRQDYRPRRNGQPRGPSNGRPWAAARNGSARRPAARPGSEARRGAERARPQRRGEKHGRREKDDRERR